MRALSVLLTLVGALSSTATIAAPPRSKSIPVQQPRFYYVGSHSWHTSIIVPRAAIPAGALPPNVIQTFADYRYLEFGWGDKKFYMARRPNVATAIDAVFSPGPSVLHVAGLNSPLHEELAWSGLVEVPCTTIEFASLCRAIGQTFDRDANGRVDSSGAGLYGHTSRFYPARGQYYLFNTCDTWTAQMMRAGGLAASTVGPGAWSAGAIMAQARRLVGNRSRQP